MRVHGGTTVFMPEPNPPIFSLSRQSQLPSSATRLFRAQANRHARVQALGSPSIVMPPSAPATTAVAVLLISLLVAATWLVEVPQIVRGSGVIMPGDGFVPIAASAQGRVTEILVAEKQRVRKGDVLLRLSGDVNAVGEESLARRELKSLGQELELREKGNEHRLAASDQKIDLIESRVSTWKRQLVSKRRELTARKVATAIAERRILRASQLIDRGSVSPDQLDRVKESAVGSQIAVLDLENRISQLQARIDESLTERKAERTDLQLQMLEYAVARQQLQRQMQSVAMKLARRVVAAQDGIVSRVRVVVGETVQRGQPLLMMQTGDAELEAWLYVATASGGTVKPGQLIDLRIDAFPHQIYGTQTAIVESVSSIALRPAELRVPLAINGPVFEVRARLLSKEIVTTNNRWQLIAGLSFQADILQDKRRLYRWMLRHVLPSDRQPDG